jgi:hypothetical protein
MEKNSSPPITANAKIKLKATLGNFSGCLKVCVISGLGTHRSGRSGFDVEESFPRGCIVANCNLRGFDSPNEARIKLNFKASPVSN